MHHLLFCIISVFDIWPYTPKLELDGTSGGTETFESCNLPGAHSWLVSQGGLDTRPPAIQPGWHSLPPTLKSHPGLQCPELTQSTSGARICGGRTVRIYEEETHDQGMKNGPIGCETASCVNGGNSLSCTCAEHIIKIHMRVIAYYCPFYCCLLSRVDE